MISLKPISISLSPNTEKDDVLLALRLLFQPWRYLRGQEASELEREFEKYSGLKYAISFNSGRSALMAILASLSMEKDSEVLLQAFTCNAASNPILWSGLKPVYVDCLEENFNMDTEDLKRKITSRSRAVIIQHTFGMPANIEETLNICRQNNLILIEDCAHSLGAKYKGKKVGTFGDVSFFSFSRDKIISSVYGGMAALNNEELARKIRDFQEKAGYPSYFWVKQQLMHPLLMNLLILPTYRLFGKYFLVLSQWLHILSKAVHSGEKRGQKPGYFPRRMPNALAGLARKQLAKAERFNHHRRELAAFYKENLKNTKYLLPEISGDSDPAFLRFSLRHPLAHDIIRKAWERNLLIGDWYACPIAPCGTNIEKLKYVLGSCPASEELSEDTLNLPTHINISVKDAKKIVDFLIKNGN
ncbi:MAG: aminotransferase class I/II-fold pyridoxal phosphate-dependent enzyme [Candidatus Pacebacteria bacterium]|nr:aminotransferase class I/II-fold pyridoxal phosphate-dependent enzyme [Candidatus Paceibacterota bacterium]